MVFFQAPSRRGDTQFVDCFLGSSSSGPAGRTHLETEVWEEPPLASWGRTEESARPRSSAGTPFCQLSINRETVGHCQLDPMSLSVRRHSSVPRFPISWLTFPSSSSSSSSSISASLVSVRFHLQLFLPLAVHHNYIPQEPPVRLKSSDPPPCDSLRSWQPGEAALARVSQSRQSPWIQQQQNRGDV